jgi:CheY-like chemotaxis protein
MIKNTDDENEWIIVAEDSPPNRTILVHLLKKMGFNVIECSDGAAAWTAYEERGNRNIVAVLSDIMMPNMDGIELLRKLRADSPELAIVLITAVSEKEYINEAKNLNVNGYILKPVTFQRVSAKLKELFPQKKFPQLQVG